LILIKNCPSLTFGGVVVDVVVVVVEVLELVVVVEVCKYEVVEVGMYGVVEVDKDVVEVNNVTELDEDVKVKLGAVVSREVFSGKFSLKSDSDGSVIRTGLVSIISSLVFSRLWDVVPEFV
jgi:hypothetical protein